MDNCIFCKISSGEIPSPKLYEDENFFIIRDIAPQAKVHLIAIPKCHVAHIDEMTSEQALLIGKILEKVSHMQQELGLTNGYRVIINQGADANQTVQHLHIHILGGELLRDF